MSQSSGKKYQLNSGDVLRIYSVLDEMEGVVRLAGHVHRPGRFRFTEGMKLSDIISDVSQLKPNPDLNYALIVREDPVFRKMSVLGINLASMLDRSVSANLSLRERDTILVFEAGKFRSLEQYISKLNSQSSIDEPPKIVSIFGNTKLPGTYPFIESMRVRDLISASYDLQLNTDKQFALLKRRNVQLNKIEFEAISLTNTEDLDKSLRPLDELHIFSIKQIKSGTISRAN